MSRDTPVTDHPQHPAKDDGRHVRLFRNGRHQAVRIPREYELPGDEAIIRRQGDCLILEPRPATAALDLLKSWGPLDAAFPDVDEGLADLDDIDP